MLVQSSSMLGTQRKLAIDKDGYAEMQHYTN